MTLLMPDEKSSALGRSSRPQLPAPMNYVNVEMLLSKLVELHAARDETLLGLDRLDKTSCLAGTPIRSIPARANLAGLLVRIRELEAMARKVWQEEFGAAQSLTPRLATLLSRAGAADATTVQKLIESDGKEISEAEFTDLMLVLDGTVVNPDRGGVGVFGYAASFIQKLDPKVLSRFTDELERLTFGPQVNSAKGQRAATLLHELRMLFSNVFAAQTDSGFPELKAKIDSISLGSLNLLLQPEHAPIVQPAISDLWLSRIAHRVLIDPASLTEMLPIDSGFQILPIRTTVLRLLESNQDAGGHALERYLKPVSGTESQLKAASIRLLALVTPNTSLPRSQIDIRRATMVEDHLAALLVRNHFARAFDSSDPTQVAKAGENLELLIVNVKDLKALSTPMTQALATGLAGAMVNPLINQQLLNATLTRTSQNLVEVGLRGFSPSSKDLFAFIETLATKPESIRTIAAAFGPMIASCAKLERGLPTDPNLVSGAGFIMGAMQVSLDKQNESRRAFIEGLAISVTVLFATGGAFAGGPFGSAGAGLLGSGIVDFIASKVNTDRTPSEIPNTPDSVRDYFLSLFMLSSYSFLDPSTTKKIQDRVALVSSIPGNLKAKFVFTGPNVDIVNIDKLSTEDLEKALDVVVLAGLSERSQHVREIATAFSDGSSAAAARLRASSGV